MSRPRIAFFTHDGTGLGHLRRLARVAAALAEDCACLFLTGQRAAPWLVPGNCELVRLPSLDSMVASKAEARGVRPFLDASSGLRLRQRVLDASLTAFRPDALVVDHLALGKNEELRAAVETPGTRKYLLLRGVLDEPELAVPEVFGDAARAVLEACYDRVLVAADEAVVDVAVEYDLPAAIAAKVRYLGYVAAPVEDDTIGRVRQERGLEPDERWVVCSAGGGALGGELIAACRKLASGLPGVAFDLVYGPRATAPERPVTEAARDGRTVVWREHRSLPLLHAAADVVICQGGYNTLLETYMGRARVVHMPHLAVDNREQPILSRRLARYLPIDTVGGVADLGAALGRALAADPVPRRHVDAGALDTGGVARFRRLLLDDLGV